MVAHSPCDHVHVIMYASFHLDVLKWCECVLLQALMEVERSLNEAEAMQSGLTEEERQQHLAEVQELKIEISSQAAATARLRESLEQRNNVIERLTANDLQQQQKIDALKVQTKLKFASFTCQSWFGSELYSCMLLSPACPARHVVAHTCLFCVEYMLLEGASKHKLQYRPH